MRGRQTQGCITMPELEEDFNYKFFKMKKGFKFDQMTASDLKYYKTTLCEQDQKMAVVGHDGKLVYVEE